MEPTQTSRYISRQKRKTLDVTHASIVILSDFDFSKSIEGLNLFEMNVSMNRDENHR